MSDLSNTTTHIKILSCKTSDANHSAFYGYERLTFTLWDNNSNTSAQILVEDNPDILCIFSDNAEEVIQLCVELDSPEYQDLSCYLITAVEDDEFINKVYQCGVKNIFPSSGFNTHLKHQLQSNLLITNEKKQSLLNREQHRKMQQLAKLGSFTWHIEKGSFYFPKATKDLLGLDIDGDFVSQSEFLALVDQVNQPHFSNMLKNIITTKISIKSNIKFRQPDHSFREFIFIAERRSITDKAVVYEGFIQDVSNLYLSSMHSLAYTDSLTGLANRRCIIDYLYNLEVQANQHGDTFSILFLDLDGFKQVNDQLGHATGDLLLIETTQHLQKIAQNNHFIGRLGGDEFCVVISDEDGRDKSTAEAFAIATLKSFDDLLFLQQHKIQASFSIGIAQFPLHADKISELLKAADTAMYEAKAKGRQCYEVYTQKLTEKNLNRIKLENELLKAYENNQFELYYQPQLSLSTQQMVGIEALIRWIHPINGMIAPDSFISIAEETGLIIQMGTWIINKACSDAQKLHQKGLKITVAVNISPVQLHSSDICEVVKQALKKSKLAPSFLELEITESSFQASQQNITIFNNLRLLGIKIAIDDFGTGYSNLASLSKLPIDVLKIDREFIKSIPHDESASALTASIIGMARIKQLKIIAEGIETIEQIQYLQAVNCDIGQGYYIGKPMEFAQIQMFLKQQQAMQKKIAYK